MRKIVTWMLKLRGLIVGLFAAASILCALMSGLVRINYNIVNYLPTEAPATVAKDVMEASYDKAVPNLRVMVPDVSIPEALQYKERLAAIEGVDDINWLDDQADLTVPLEMLDKDTVADWYVNGDALYSIVVNEDLENPALAQIREIIGEEGAMSGNPVDSVNAQNSTSTEIAHMMMIIIPLIFAILLFTTCSWFEPVLFMASIGVSILINMGTNLIFGEISFITNTTSAILQLACSMDYAIFLLDRFEEFRDEGLHAQEAMTEAILKSASSILSSGLTTVVGFAALIIMRFKIGPDMGLVLAKGIVFSLITTLVFLPCLAMYCYRLIEKTKHRSFMPSFRLFAKATTKIKTPVALFVVVLLVPCYLAQHQVSYQYGMSGMAAPGSQVAIDRDTINNQFGESISFALMVPKGSRANEQALNDEIKALPETSSVLSYVESVGKTIPESYLPQDTLSQLNSDLYTRLVISARLPSESDETFAYVETLRELGQKYYPDNYLLAGEAANVYDMKDTITADSIKVNLVAIGAIAIILLFTFHSFSLPFILLMTIESSIFINVAVPYFLNQNINYIGYLIISSVQLGATVDYAILFTNRYIDNRRLNPFKRQAALQTVSDTAGSILTSGGILTSAGFIIGFICTNQVISQLGILIARGTILSVILVLVFLPAMLTAFERLIIRTSRKLNFPPASHEEHPESAAPSAKKLNPVFWNR